MQGTKTRCSPNNFAVESYSKNDPLNWIKSKQFTRNLIEAQMQIQTCGKNSSAINNDLFPRFRKIFWSVQINLATSWSHSCSCQLNQEAGFCGKIEKHKVILRYSVLNYFGEKMTKLSCEHMLCPTVFLWTLIKSEHFAFGALNCHWHCHLRILWKCIQNNCQFILHWKEFSGVIFVWICAYVVGSDKCIVPPNFFSPQMFLCTFCYSVSVPWFKHFHSSVSAFSHWAAAYPCEVCQTSIQLQRRVSQKFKNTQLLRCTITGKVKLFVSCYFDCKYILLFTGLVLYFVPVKARTVIAGIEQHSLKCWCLEHFLGIFNLASDLWAFETRAIKDLYKVWRCFVCWYHQVMKWFCSEKYHLEVHIWNAKMPRKTDHIFWPCWISKMIIWRNSFEVWNAVCHGNNEVSWHGDCTLQIVRSVINNGWRMECISTETLSWFHNNQWNSCLSGGGINRKFGKQSAKCWGKSTFNQYISIDTGPTKQNVLKSQIQSQHFIKFENVLDKRCIFLSITAIMFVMIKAIEATKLINWQNPQRPNCCPGVIHVNFLWNMSPNISEMITPGKRGQEYLQYIFCDKEHLSLSKIRCEMRRREMITKLSVDCEWHFPQLFQKFLSIPLSAKKFDTEFDWVMLFWMYLQKLIPFSSENAWKFWHTYATVL